VTRVNISKIHIIGLVRYKKVSMIISLGINPNRGGMPPKLRIGMVKFVVTICLLGCRLLILILLRRRITVTTTVE